MRLAGAEPGVLVGGAARGSTAAKHSAVIGMASTSIEIGAWQVGQGHPTAAR